MNRDEAERQIGQILKQLEKDSTMLVDSICIKDIDITNIDSVRRELLCRVHIELRPVPGRRW